MENKIAQYISNKLVQREVVSPDLKDVYVYGLELILSFLTSTLMIILMGVIIHRIALTLVFLSIFIALRRFTGGYHAATYLKCKISTISTYLVVVTLSLLSNIPVWSYILLFIIGLIIILQFGPIENVNKPLTNANKTKNKILSLVLYTAIILFGIIVHAHLQQLSNAVFYTLTSVIALMIIPILKKGGNTNEKKNRKASR